MPWSRNLSTVNERDTPPDTQQADAQPGAAERKRGHHPTRRTWTLVISVLVAGVIALVSMLVEIPYVALGPGPTYDTLGTTGGVPVVKISDKRNSNRTTGELRLTTVSVTDEITLLGGLGMWISGRYALAPRELYYPPGESDEDVKQKNVKQFQDSQSTAETAALQYLRENDEAWADKIDMEVVIKEITTGSPADGLLDAGDQLLTVNGKKVTDAASVRAALEDTRPGDDIQVTYLREGAKAKTGDVTLGKADDGREQGFMGLVAADMADAGFDIDIELTDVGGPSAGLIFSLAIVDRLTRQDLTDGQLVAGTGEISPDGTVGQIGGIGFKLLAAQEDGARIFLVPAQNCAEALAEQPDGLRLVKVGTLADAVSALRAIGDGKKPPTC